MRLGSMAALAAVSFAAPAWGQGGPRFDCAKASGEVEREICRSGELSTADRDLATGYAALLAGLGGPARDHLMRDQARWLVNRDRACFDVDDAGVDGDCLAARYAARGRLLLFSQGAYSFVVEQAIVKSGLVKTELLATSSFKRVGYKIDLAYPQFDGPSADFSAVNRRFADEARSIAVDVVPWPDGGRAVERQWSHRESFDLHRPGPNAIAVDMTYAGVAGGGRPYSRRRATLVDLKTGKAVGPESVFAADDAFGALVSMVHADLKEQFADRQDLQTEFEPAILASLLRDPGRHLFRGDRLELIFNTYDIGTYAAGPRSVEISYDRLKPLLRADGPLGSLR